MTITLNGSQREIADGTTVEQLVGVFSLPPRGVALAMDGEVIPRPSWPSTLVVSGARVEVITAVQGG
ncbi:MAG: sulfur carrier protein [Actinomycetota bacterium]|jgi:sulfur carrier protein|nr:sulfur carrier protein [Actinomycetota bacterium]